MPLSLAAPMSLLALLAGPAERREPAVHSVTIEQQVIMRVPVRPRSAPGIEWRERSGPRCIGIRDLVGATLSGPSSIDFVYRNRGRYRARLDSGCAALDFYKGFYLQPDDGRICAGRDVIRSRIGAICQIQQFRTLKPRIRRRIP
jgi:hypothetical protein